MIHKFALGLGVLLAIVSPALAQSTGMSGGGSGTGVGGSTVEAGTQMGRGNISSEDFNKLQDAADMSKRVKSKGKSLDDLVKEDTLAATVLAAAMPLACKVDKAQLVAEGPEMRDGKSIQTKTYEAACSNGVGYFLVARENAAPSGFSCLAADAARIADQKAGLKPGIVCALPELADPKAMTSVMITRAGKACSVRDYRYLGLNAASHTEFDEIACSDNSGYIAAIALPGSTAPVRLSTCRESALRGLPCKLSDNGGPVITVETFKQALQQHGVSCSAADSDVHIFGQENAQKRYVVEFKCPERRQGLVSYIPLTGNNAPFEAIDCAAAQKRGVTCLLTAPK